MEVITLNNNHIKEENEYGCICYNCGTVFIFKENEVESILIENMLLSHINCPNCHQYISSKYFKLFRNNKQKEKFISKHRWDK